MENASKALIIAGAILISILIVGLGVIIYNNVSGIATDANMDTQAISTHNSPFEGYYGESQSGSNVRALMTAVSANNRSAAANDENIGNRIQVRLVDGSTAETTITSGTAIKTGRTYKVKAYTTSNTDGGTYDEDGVESYGDDDNETAGQGLQTYWSNGYVKTIYIEANQD